MTYKEFIEKLAKNGIKLEDVALELGYSVTSIKNNWGKNNEIPKNAIRAIELYFEVIKLRNETGSNQECLDEVAKIIAKEKCEKNNIPLSDYLSSLVKANI